MKRALWIMVALAVLAGGGWYWWFHRQADSKRSFKTVKVDRGTVVQTVKATGIVQPVLTIQCGTQVNGPVQKLYVDFNDTVKAGDIIAQIDPSVYQARVAQDEASLKQALASLDEARAKLVQAEKELARSAELTKRDLLSQSDLDAAVASHDTLAAQVKVSEATVEQSRATLLVSKANLAYTTIRSPVDGVVIARNVSEGQTVVASMTAQTLFQIATDLRLIQVEASIPEADIGAVRVGQIVRFSVDAHDLEFAGRVTQIRLSASTLQNVVTYPVVISAENPDRKLFPGMTANIACEVGRQEEVLRVPNAALRFKPDVAAGGSASGRRSSEAGGGGRGRQMLWKPDGTGQQAEPVPVKVGLSDGVFTELKDAGSLQAESDVIIGYNETGSASAASTVNPFAPKFPSGRSGRPH